MNKKQIAVFIGAIGLFVLLLFANTKLPKDESKPQMSDHAGAKSKISIGILVDSAKKALSGTQKQIFDKLDEALKTASDKKIVFGKIVSQWDSLKQPAIAAYYMEQEAIASGLEKNWNEAGNRYYNATRFANQDEKQLLYDKAIESFEKTLELNPKNIEAKISLGACYVEGSSNPMKGIGLLREIEKTDSNNVNLQLNFAFFSEKSGQLDKAISRFKKVITIKPDFIEAYLHLAEAYEQKGDKPKAIESLEKYYSMVSDTTVKTEVRNYINKLKN